MKKTKLLTSLAAFVLVLGLGACETTSEEETTPDESETTTETTGTSESTPTTPSEDPDGYVLVGDFIDSNWDAKVDTSSKYYIPLGTTEYKATVTIAAEPDYGEYEPWDAGLRVVEWGDSWNLVVGSDDLAEGSAEGLYGDDSKNIKVSWGETYDITVTFGDTNSILVTVHEDSENEGETEVFSGTYKLGALDEGNYCYRYFDGKTTSGNNPKLTTTADWDEAVDVTIELDESAIETLDDEEELTGTPYTLSFTDGDGATKYISWSSSTNVDLSDTAYTWYWVDNYQFFAAGSLDGRFLVYYADSQDIRAYSQSTPANFNYPYIQPYIEAQENPEAPETSRTESDFAKVSSLESGKEYYIGGTYNSSLYLATGEMGNNYRLAGSSNLDNAAAFTITGDNTDGYKLTLADGTYLYAFYNNSYHDFGLSDATTIPDNGTNLFFWDNTSATLYINGSSIGSSYTYAYFEMYNGNIALWGASNTSSFSSAASFYQLVTA